MKLEEGPARSGRKCLDQMYVPFGPTPISTYLLDRDECFAERERERERERGDNDYDDGASGCGVCVSECASV